MSSREEAMDLGESSASATSEIMGDAASGGGSESGPVELPAVSEEDQARANALKDEGNEKFKRNRAFAHLKMENFGAAIEDATSALKLDASYVKGNYRRGTAYLALGKPKDARKEFRAVVRKRPHDKLAKSRLTECERAVKKMLFEQAIAVEHTKSIWERVDAEAIEVEASYNGPHLPAIGEPHTSRYGLTLQFVREMMEHFRLQKRLHRKYAIQLLHRLHGLLRSLPSLVEATVPETVVAEAEEGRQEQPGVMNVCGDTHGQFYDLLNIFKINGEPGPHNPYIFNGDFVDRGSFSVENVMTLFAFKLLYPNDFHLTRGNHETKTMNKMYGFEGEVQHKYDDKVMEMFTEVFHALPLAVTVHSEKQGGAAKVLIVHGGLFAEDGVKLDDIARVRRFSEPPETGIMTELLWSDPQPMPGRAPSKRGTGKSFGPDVTERFLADNGLELLIRSHEVKDEGYLMEHNGKCITVFSAPNYCDQMGNKGAIVRLDPDCKPSYVQFEAVAHPPVRPMAYATGIASMMGMV